MCRRNTIGLRVIRTWEKPGVKALAMRVAFVSLPFCYFDGFQCLHPTCGPLGPCRLYFHNGFVFVIWSPKFWGFHTFAKLPPRWLEAVELLNVSYVIPLVHVDGSSITNWNFLILLCLYFPKGYPLIAYVFFVFVQLSEFPLRLFALRFSPRAIRTKYARRRFSWFHSPAL